MAGDQPTNKGMGAEFTSRSASHILLHGSDRAEPDERTSLLGSDGRQTPTGSSSVEHDRPEGTSALDAPTPGKQNQPRASCFPES